MFKFILFILSHKFLDNMKKLLLTTMALSSALFAFAQTARVQVIHNCADLAADSVDVYLGTDKAIDNFAFRTATGFFDAPAGVPIIVSIAPKGSDTVTDAIYSDTLTLMSGEKYVVVANGIVSPSGYTPGVSTVPFRLSVYSGAREVSTTAGSTDVLVMHGCTDAPQVDVRAGSTVLVDNIPFGSFNSTGYVTLPESDYTVAVTTADGATTVANYSVPLNTLNLGDSAITVLASGFLDSTVNSNGKSFGLWVATRMGGALIPLPKVPTSITNINKEADVTIYPNPANDVLYFTDKSGVANNTVSIMDVSGKVVTTVKNVSNASFSLTNLSAGVYFVRVQSERGTTTTKFIKE